MKKVTFSGGFHKVAPISLRVSDKAFNALEDVKNGFTDISEWVEHFLSKWQESRLNKHFCGISGCTCGSYCRATIE